MSWDLSIFIGFGVLCVVAPCVARILEQRWNSAATLQTVPANSAYPAPISFAKYYAELRQRCAQEAAERLEESNRLAGTRDLWLENIYQQQEQQRQADLRRQYLNDYFNEQEKAERRRNRHAANVLLPSPVPNNGTGKSQAKGPRKLPRTRSANSSSPSSDNSYLQTMIEMEEIDQEEMEWLDSLLAPYVQ